jgi:hypothetical protein
MVVPHRFSREFGLFRLAKNRKDFVFAHMVYFGQFDENVGRTKIRKLLIGNNVRLEHSYRHGICYSSADISKLAQSADRLS